MTATMCWAAIPRGRSANRCLDSVSQSFETTVLRATARGEHYCRLP
jgi:hypothetical protein